jgi:2,4-dienoyl-CoA reductase (NADPH2)
MASNSYHKILEPGRIGPVTTRNRILKTGAGMLMWHEDDTAIRPEILAFYEGMARGGTGLIIVESPTIDYPTGCRWRMRYRIDDDKYIEGLKELVGVIHKHGCPTFMQMNHDGPWQAKLFFEPDPPFTGIPVAASDVTVDLENDFHSQHPHVLTIPEIEALVDKFAAAAERAKKAGFDGVDVNAASSHLVHNFLSPFWNRRTDIYGGSAENRSRFACQIISEIKRRCGKDFACSMIINGLEVGMVAGVDNAKCLTPEAGREMAPYLEKAGVDALQIRSHWIGYHVGAYLVDSLYYPEPPVPVEQMPKEYYTKKLGAGANILLAAGIKKVVNIPVTVVGRMDADLGEEILEKGWVDFIGMTRRLHADPAYCNKLKAGRPEDIAPCTGCDNCLGSKRCRINALLGTPFNTIEKAPKKKKVMVIGGGPGGLEAARVSAVRGHDVTLYERASKLGGLLPLAAMVKGPHPEDLSQIIDYFSGQMNRLGVKVVLGKEATLADVEREKPDVVYLAAGGIPTTPAIEGINGSNVISGGDLHKRLKFFSRFFGPYTLRWLSKFYMPIGHNVVIVGGGIQGCELGEFLTKRGKKVTIVDKAEMLGDGMVDALLGQLLTWFNKKGVTLISGVKEYVEITRKGLTIIDRDGKKQVLNADTVVPAVPLTANAELAKGLKNKVSEVYVVGDSGQPGLIADAIGQACRTAREV